MPNRRTSPSGLLVIDKPTGLTSMDIVRRVRDAGRGVKTGHAGTLDPLATGVLICCLGKTTKTIERLMDRPKTYEATLDLSAFTDTGDSQGEPEWVAVTEPPAREAIKAELARFVGWIDQMPPAHSAIKLGGRRAYDLARQGQAVDMPTRPVRIDALTLRDYAWPVVQIDIRCGKGTYIRSLARDLGRALGTGGHLTQLRRSAVGEYTVDLAWTLEALPAPLTEQSLLPPPSD